MINRIFFCLLIACLHNYDVLAQDSLSFTTVTNDNTVFLSRVIDGTLFTVDRSETRNEFTGSRLFSKVGDEMVEEVSIYQLGDSLNVNILQDFWKRGDDYYMLLYTSNLAGTRNYFTLAYYDRAAKQIFILDNEPFIYYTPFGNYDFKDLYIDGVKTWIYIEYSNDRFDPAAYVKLEIIGNSLVSSRFDLSQFKESDVLYDSYYDEVDKVFYLYATGYMTVLDQNFNLKYRQEYKSLVDGAIRRYFEVYMMGIRDNKLIILERILNFKNLNKSLNVRKSTIADSLIIPLEFEPLNPTEDCYLVRKVFKEECNYLFYTKSIINNFNTDYGFNILVFNKKGDILRTIEIPSTEEMTIFDMDVDEANNTIYGNGGFKTQRNQFVFRLKVDNLKLSTTTDQTTTAIATLYPNPTTGICYLSGMSPQASVVVRGIDGRSYYIGKYDDNAGIDLSTAPSGLYVVTITTGQKTQSLKVVKN